MQQNFKDVEFLFPKNFNEEHFSNQKTFEPFSDKSKAFLNDLSQELTKDRNTRAYPDVATFAFFCRKANIQSWAKKYQYSNTLRLGRGIIFHIAPSNVPVNFAFSLVSGILSGNVNVVRVSSKYFEQVTLICNAIKRVCEKEDFKEFEQRIVLVKYDRNSTATKYFSAFCDVRVIWGGDETIAEVRKNQIPARSFDVTFADRYSLCVINADEFVKEAQLDKIAEGFYNDTYLFDQNACSAPHLLVWTGKKENVPIAKEKFWLALHKIVSKKYAFQSVMAVDKLTAFYEQTLLMDRVEKANSSDNLVWRVKLENLPHNIDEFRCAGGYFSEFHASSINEISSIINRKYQTLAYYGFSKEELEQFVTENTPVGIDRIVPIGRTSDFSLIWDGFELIYTLSRNCDILAK